MKKLFSLKNYIDKEAECEDEIQSKKSDNSNLNSPSLSLNNSINENMENENKKNNHKELLKKIIKKEDEEIEKLIKKKYFISQNIKKPNIPFEKENKIIKKVFSKDISNKNNNKEKISNKVHCLISPKKEENNNSNIDYENLKFSYERKFKKFIHERSSDFKRDFIKTIKEDNKILENVIEINKKNINDKNNKKEKFIPYSQRVLNLHSQNSYLNKIKKKTQD